MSPYFHDIRTIEELSMTAWPALQAVYDDGWVLRFANGYTRRANSANPLYPAIDDLDIKIARCEAFFASRSLNTVVKLTPASAELDPVLEQRGYYADGHVSIQTVDLSQVALDGIQPAILAERASEDWIAPFTRLNNVDARYHTVIRFMLANIVPRTCFASIIRDGEIAAVGLGVLDRGYIGLFDIVVGLPWRRQGLGRQIVLNLLRWGAENGAHSSYLQVVQTNTPALRLYEQIGYREIYPYWYRIKPLASI